MSLLEHCAVGDLTEIESILKDERLRRNRLHTRDILSWTCLHHAVTSGSVECIKFLLTLEELDILAETCEGETALHIACTVPHISAEIVSLLIEAHSDLINFVNNNEVDLLQCAIIAHRLDIVKLLVNNGAPVNKQDLNGNTALHIAAKKCELEIVRYLQVEANIDASICNNLEFTACYEFYTMLLRKLLDNLTLTQAEIDCFEELLLFTYDFEDLSNPSEMDVGLREMILWGYRFNEKCSGLYKIISRLYCAPPCKDYYLQKILTLNVLRCYCLIYALLGINVTSKDPIYPICTYLFTELFTLCVADESFFDEFISEIMSTEWNSSLQQVQAVDFFIFVKQSVGTLERRKLFHFLKTLLSYDIDVKMLMSFADILPATVIESVFAPLDRAVIPRYQLQSGRYDFMSLKNMCRTTIRRYYFDNYSHYYALKALYSLEVPTIIRNFLCYNVEDFKF